MKWQLTYRSGWAWLGGWCCRTVARRLHDEGHDVYPVTLTGLGEQVHLASSEVDLDTYITDVVNLVEFENLNDVVLLGHSYAGVRSQEFICSQRGGEFAEGAENEREVLRMRRWLVIFAAGLAIFISASGSYLSWRMKSSSPCAKGGCRCLDDPVEGSEGGDLRESKTVHGDDLFHQRLLG
ncbi:MAG: hypothetical protein M3305_03605 [Actinomycetota bacterium]|nr:hypothetical protein [Actinomycetota bacterium]